LAGTALQTVHADGPFNMAKLLVGSEGTLGFFTAIDLQLQELPRAKALGICHFPSFADAMRSTQALVALDPVAVELFDRTMIELSRENPEFAPTMAAHVRGEPGRCCWSNSRATKRNPGGEAGRARGHDGVARVPGAVVKLTAASDQAAVWYVRSQGLNIMTSTRGDPKPVSIIEDCAVRWNISPPIRSS